MNDSNLDKILNDFESAYFNDEYNQVIQIWENNLKGKFFLSKPQIIDDKILQALMVSYWELGLYKRSIYYADLYIKDQLMNKDGNTEFRKNLDFAYMLKTTILAKERKIIQYFKTLTLYIKQGGSNNQLLKSYNETEQILFKKFNKINQYYVYFFVAVIILKYVLNAVNIYISDLAMFFFLLFSLAWIFLTSFSKSLGLKIMHGILKIF